MPFEAAFVVLRGLIMVPVGAMDLSWPGMALSGLWEGGLWAVWGSGAWHARGPCLGGFILLVSFRDTLLAVSIFVYKVESSVYPTGKLQ